MKGTIETDRRRVVTALVMLALLALLAAGAWYGSTVLTKPLTSADDVEQRKEYRHISSIYGSGPDRLNRPSKVAVDSQGRIYTADSNKHRVVVFDQGGSMVKTLGGPAIVQGALKFPASVAVDARGRVYVTSKSPDKVVIFSPEGEPINTIPVEQPLTLTIDGDRLYIVTSKGILIGDLDGAQVGQLSGRGADPGRIDRASGLALDEDGTLYVADSLNYRFQALRSDGEVKWVDGNAPDPSEAVVDRTRKYGLPVDITVGSDGLLYGLDAFNGEVVVFDRDGKALGTYGAWGRKDGEFYYPSSIRELSPERFVIADTYNDRLQIVEIPSPRPSTPMLARRALPWLAPVALLLAFVALLRRRPLVVTDAQGLRRAAQLGVLPELLGMTKELYVPDGTAEECAELLETDPSLAKVLREAAVPEEIDVADAVMHIAKQLRGSLGMRRVSIALPEAAVAQVARDAGIGVLEPATVLEGEPAAA